MNDFAQLLKETADITLEEFETEALESLKELHKEGKFLDISDEQARKMVKEI